MSGDQPRARRLNTVAGRYPRDDSRGALLEVVYLAKCFDVKLRQGFVEGSVEGLVEAGLGLYRIRCGDEGYLVVVTIVGEIYYIG